MEFRIARESPIPAYMQIRNHLRAQILAGDLPPGTRLPPERKMAQMLGVSRTTVVSAYDELAAEGLVEARVGRGTVVVGSPFPRFQEGARVQPIAWQAHLSSLAQRLQVPTAAELLTLRELGARPRVLSFAGGLPDPTLIPSERYSEAWGAVLRQVGAAAAASSPVQGVAPLRSLIAERLAERGISATPEHIVVISGSQQGLDLLTRLLTEPGDTVICEAPTYFMALQAFKVQGLRVIGVPVDRDGMDVGRVEALVARYRPRFIYTIPNFQNPTGTILSLERRQRLLSIAQRYQVPIVEDDPFGEIWFQEPPPPPIKSLDEGGHVIYLSTFSKCLAPGLRIGWLTAPRPVVDMALLLRRVADLQSNTAGQYLVLEFAQRGWLDEGIALARQVYGARCQAMDEALRRHMPPGARWHRPGGGLFLWLELPKGVAASRLLDLSGKEGVIFLPGQVLYPAQGPRNVCRLGYTDLSEEEIARGVAILGRALRKLLRSEREPSPRGPAVDTVV
ncbi:MAG: PLP-dependent aminotransferase family protein [Anaerolineae bacterium]|nr:PLP-dependent aminotransferase family protein [Anaerolineae bacterium]